MQIFVENQMKVVNAMKKSLLASYDASVLNKLIEISQSLDSEITKLSSKVAQEWQETDLLKISKTIASRCAELVSISNSSSDIDSKKIISTAQLAKKKFGNIIYQN